VLDKTGTVTEGRMSVVAVVPEAGTDADELLRLAGAIEHASEHPIARAIASTATGSASQDRVSEPVEGSVGTPTGSEIQLDLPSVESFQNVEGRGVTGVVEGRALVVGRLSLLEEWSLHPSAELLAAKADAESAGQTVVLVAWDGESRGLIVVADEVKATSAEAVTQVMALGLTPILLTGDNEQAAQHIAAQVGIGRVIAEVLPADKVAVVSRLQAEGRVVAMVGDGVNDAPALAQADLGMAMGTGTDVAIEASDITLVRGDLRAASDAIRLSRRTLGTIKGNLFWAFAYNTAAIPLAALGLLNPMLAGAAMAFSSVFVVGNSLRLRTFR
jgi:Cu+-exporting ATPase